MMDRRRVAAYAMLLGLLAALNGCSFFHCSGGGPLTRDELKDWAGIPDAAGSDAESLRLKAESLREETAKPYELWVVHSRGESRFGLLPGTVDYERMSWREIDGGGKVEIYSAGSTWGSGAFIGDIIAGGRLNNAYDLASGNRVAASMATIYGTPLGYHRKRLVLPVENTQPAENSHTMLLGGGDNQPLYNLKDGTVILGGLAGWGRVNHKKYIQILWIPIPVGKVEQ